MDIADVKHSQSLFFFFLNKKGDSSAAVTLTCQIRSDRIST